MFSFLKLLNRHSLVCLAFTLVTTISTEQSFAQQSSQSNVFEMPTVSENLQTAILAIRSNQYPAAHKALQVITSKYPWFVQGHYLQASLFSITGDRDAAFNALEQAVAAGLSNTALLQKDRNLAPLRKDERFQKLLEEIIQNQNANEPSNSLIKPKAATVKQSTALVSGANTFWDPKLLVLKSLFAFDSRKAAPATVQNAKDPAAKMLNTLFQRGLAAGNAGDIYDNRDRKHSSLHPKSYPQLAFTHYSNGALQNNIDYGLNTKILFGAPTFGNSSTAVSSGPYWRSQPRLAYTAPNGPKHLTFQYFNNHIYVYPAVSDFKDQQDHLPTNSPYMIISEGKSGSDRPFLKAIATILAAFKPAEKDALIKSRMLSSAVQYVFRRSQASVVSDKDYFTAKAHPAVFSAKELSYRTMIKTANDLVAQNFPSPVLLKATEESRLKDGIDDFTRKLPEQLFDTPATIARVIRASGFTKTMKIQAKSTTEDTDETLKYRWVVLQGDTKKIRIKPENEQANTVTLEIDWHEPFENAARSEFKSTRVEIGVFAVSKNGVSAPSFITFLYPKHQNRSYDANGKLLSIDHQHKPKAYIDPQVFTRRDWKDEFQYDDADRLTGWIRSRGSNYRAYSRHGALILSSDELGRPLKAEKITYNYERQENGTASVSEELTGKYINYEYLSDDDRLGIVVRK